MTKWLVQKLTHRTTQKHVQHHDATGIMEVENNVIYTGHVKSIFNQDKLTKKL